MSELAFELQRVSKTYHIWRWLRKIPRIGVRDVSLAVPRGVIFGLLGLNGAGKTTAMKLLVGLLEPDAGQVRVLGGELSDPRIRARIGFLPELPYLPQQFTADGLLKAYGQMCGLSGRNLDTLKAKALELVGLDSSRKESLQYFSKGMRQRVAMAQVLLHEPDAVFVDEPMSGLDPLGMREMRRVLLNLKASGVTVCLNSHQIPEVERLCDRVGVMSNGRIVLEGAVGELLALASARRYRLTLLVPDRRGVPGSARGWSIQEVDVGERQLAATLAAQRKRGARALQILAVEGSLEEVMLQSVQTQSIRSIGEPASGKDYRA